MKATLKLLIVSGMLALQAHSQDLITKRSGEDIKAKIIEIGLNEVKYKRFDNPDGPLIIISKEEILIIRYENGQKEIFDSPALTSTKKSIVQDWKYQGELDAQKYYRGYRAHWAGTFIPTIFIGPLFGLIPAIGNSSAQVKDKHLVNDNNPDWFKNPDYHQAYTRAAKKMKTKKVWGGYLGGSLIFLGILVGASSAIH